MSTTETKRCSLSWRTILDLTIGFGGVPAPESVSPLALAAVAAASSVPPCGVCEAVYAEVLVRYYGIDQLSITSNALFDNCVYDTLFALGRAGYLGLILPYLEYKPYALIETCIALHDMDLVRAADGLLAISATASPGAHQLSNLERRFVIQAIATIDLLLELFPQPSARAVFAAASERLNNEP